MSFFFQTALRLATENRGLRLALHREQHKNLVLSSQLEQARRDVELLALGWTDRKAALEFIRTNHALSALSETKEMS